MRRHESGNSIDIEALPGVDIGDFTTITASATITILDSQFSLGSTSIKVEAAVGDAEHVNASYSYSAPVSETASPQYRKVGLDGRPIPDSKPQSEEESDEEPEETYIDALTGDFRHSVTDVYVPVPASDLVLSVRRNTIPEVWAQDGGLRPEERPDRPFGAGWSSNLSSYIDIQEEIAKDDADPDAYYKRVFELKENRRKDLGLSQIESNRAVVVDENGATFEFFIWYEYDTSTQTYNKHFYPVPNGQHEQEAYLATLVQDEDKYEFTKKHGTKLVFQPTTLSLQVSGDRIFGSKQYTRHEYSRLETVTDRLGAQLTYDYGSSDESLIPTKITAEDRGLSIAIEHNNGRIDKVRDPNGNEINYYYDTVDDIDGMETVNYRLPSGDPFTGDDSGVVTSLESVSHPAGGSSKYKYEIVSEIDYKPPTLRKRYPFSGSRYDTKFYHLNITNLKDAKNYEYTINYEAVPSTYAERVTHRNIYVSQPTFSWVGDHWEHSGQFRGTYKLSGGPRRVTSVTRPIGSFSLSYPSEENIVEPDANGNLTAAGRKTVVTDIAGKIWKYTWSEVEAEKLTALKEEYANNSVSVQEPLMVYYKTLKIEAPQVGALPLFEIYSFSPEAGMAVVYAKDLSGNITEFEYEDSFTRSYPVPGQGAVVFGGKYNDPTREVRKTSSAVVVSSKSFDYASPFRIMSDIWDYEGGGSSNLVRHTEYTVNTLNGNREREIIKGDGGEILSDTSYTYSSSVPGFMKTKTVKAGTSGPSWEHDLLTTFEPDTPSYRVQSESISLGGGQSLSTEYTYDNNGNRKSVKDPEGFKTYFSYDRRNRLIAVHHPDGTTRTLKYDANGNKEEETDENGVITFYAYDSLNRLVKTTLDLNGNNTADSRGSDLVTDTEYDPSTGYKISVTDPRGNATEFDYDDIGRVKKMQQYTTANGTLTTFYDYSGDNSGGSAFDTSGFQPTTVTDARGVTTTYTYDALYRKTSETVDYDSSPFVVARKWPEGTSGNSTTFYKEIDIFGNAWEIVDPLDNKTKFEYDALSRVKTKTVAYGTPEASATRNFYTGTGFLYKQTIEKTDSETLVFEKKYDRAGRLKEEISPSVIDGSDGSAETPVTSYEYDDNGNVTSMMNPLEMVWEYVYDSRNRKIEEVAPAIDLLDGTNSHPITDWVFDAVGNVIATVDPLLNYTDTIYDAAGRPVWSISPETQIMLSDDSTVTGFIVTQNIHDANGNILESYTGAHTDFATLYSAIANDLGQAIVIDDPVELDLLLLEPRLTVSNTYDQLNRLLTSTQQVAAAVGSQITVTNEYDRVGNRTAVIDGKGQRTEFAYDGLNRLTITRDPALLETVLWYNELNNTKRTDSLDVETEYTHDAQNRISSVIYPPSGVTRDRSYSYDLLGNILGVDESPFATAEVYDVTGNIYDALSRITSENSAGENHTYSYDLAGNRLKTTYGGTNREILSTYDELNRLETLTEDGRTTTYTYDLNGNVVQKELPNGDTVSMAYDGLNRVIQMSADSGNATPLYSFTYKFDAFGNLRRINESYPSGQLADRTVTNTYDEVHRLLTESVDTGSGTITTEYAYDDANNRTRKTITGGAGAGDWYYLYDNNLNQLDEFFEDQNGDDVWDSGEPRTTYTYNDNGARTSSQVEGQTAVIYTYDAENRLIGYNGGVAQDVYAYGYDYRTRRVVRDESGGTSGDLTRIVFSGGTSVQEYDAADALQVEYIRGSDWGGGVGGILYTLRDSIGAYTHNNSRGDIVAKTSDAGSLTYLAAYEAFGKHGDTPSSAEWGTNPDRQQANSKDEDPTGLLNEGFRYRDLETGTFLTRDPLGFVDGPNLYAYVRQNPWTFFDPLGLAPAIDEDTEKEYRKEAQNRRDQASGLRDRADKIREKAEGKPGTVPRAAGMNAKRLEDQAAALEQSAKEIDQITDVLVMDETEWRGGLSDVYGRAMGHSAVPKEHLLFLEAAFGESWYADMKPYLDTAEAGTAVSMFVSSLAMPMPTLGVAGTAATKTPGIAARGTLQTTAHGAERIAGATATRGGVLSEAGVATVRQGGRVMTQADGATVRVLQNQTGRFNVVVEGERGIITTFENLSQKSLDRLGKNYGWK